MKVKQLEGNRRRRRKRKAVLRLAWTIAIMIAVVLSGVFFWKFIKTNGFRENESLVASAGDEAGTRYSEKNRVDIKELEKAAAGDAKEGGSGDGVDDEGSQGGTDTVPGSDDGSGQDKDTIGNDGKDDGSGQEKDADGQGGGGQEKEADGQDGGGQEKDTDGQGGGGQEKDADGQDGGGQEKDADGQDGDGGSGQGKDADDGSGQEGAGEKQGDGTDVAANPEDGSKTNLAEKYIAFSFDDGPSTVTDRILDALEKYGARATFFTVGYQLDKYSDATKRAYELGCEIGNHTANHANLTKISSKKIKSEVNGVQKILDELIGAPEPALVRPPYGSYDDKVLETVGVPLINWSVDSLDWKSRDCDSVVKEVNANVEPGRIILMHDLYESTAEAVEELVPQLMEDGYHIVTVTQLFEHYGIELEAGKIYREAK